MKNLSKNILTIGVLTLFALAINAQQVTTDYKIQKIIEKNKDFSLNINIEYPQFVESKFIAKSSIDTLNLQLKKTVEKYQIELKESFTLKKTDHYLEIKTEAVYMNDNIISIIFKNNTEGIGPKVIGWSEAINFNFKKNKFLKYKDCFLADKASMRKVIKIINTKLLNECKIDTLKSKTLVNFAFKNDTIEFPLSDYQVSRACEMPIIKIHKNLLLSYMNPNNDCWLP